MNEEKILLFNNCYVRGNLLDEFMRAVRKYDTDKVHSLMMQDGLKAYNHTYHNGRTYGYESRRILIDRFITNLLS